VTQDEDVGQVGYRKPPRSARFTKGRSGNPKGRPKGSRRGTPYEAVLGQKVTIREEGIERKITAAEAFLLHLTKRGLEGDEPATRATLAALDGASTIWPGGHGQQIDTIVRRIISPGNPNSALLPLRMAVKLDRYRPTARIELEPWLIEAALARLGNRRLTLAEQKTVVQAARTPRKVDWPYWWKAQI